MGIDLGPSTVLVYVKGEGVVVNEPAVMATDEKGARVLAVGRAASELVGRGGEKRGGRPGRAGDGAGYDVGGPPLYHPIWRHLGPPPDFPSGGMVSGVAR